MAMDQRIAIPACSEVSLHGLIRGSVRVANGVRSNFAYDVIETA